MNGFLVPEYQKTFSYKLYAYWERFRARGGIQAALFLLAFILVQELAGSQADAAGTANKGFFGMGDDGTLEEAEFTGSGKGLVSKMKVTWTAAQAFGSFIAGLGLILTALKYRSEDNPERAQQCLTRGFGALVIINLALYIVNFFSGTYMS